MLILSSGCMTAIQRESVTLTGGVVVDYITGKVAGDGQEANFRDAWVDGKPVISNYASGQSLTGQILQGTVSSAMIAGGMVGGAALLRPTKINQSESEVSSVNVDGDNQSTILPSSLLSETPTTTEPVVINNTLTATGGEGGKALSKSSSKGGNAKSSSSAKQSQLQGQQQQSTNVNSNKNHTDVDTNVKVKHINGSTKPPKSDHHSNKSGGHDDTNPGNHGNDNGYDNPGKSH